MYGGIDGKKQVVDLPPFQPKDENGKEFNLCFLTNLYVDENYTNRNEETYPILCIEFHDHVDVSKANHIFVHRFNQPETEDHMTWMNDRIQSLYQVYKTIPKEGIGQNAKDFISYIKQIENDFGKGKKAIYFNIPVWLKLTARKGYLNLPFRNFIQKYVKDKACTLVLGAKETVVPRNTVSKGNIAGSNSATPNAGADNVFAGFDSSDFG